MNDLIRMIESRDELQLAVGAGYVDPSSVANELEAMTKNINRIIRNKG